MTLRAATPSLSLRVVRTACLVNCDDSDFREELAARYAPFYDSTPPAIPDLTIDLRLRARPVRVSWEPRFVTHPGVDPIPAPPDYDPARDGRQIPYEVSVVDGKLRVSAEDTMRAELDTATGEAYILQTASIYLFHSALRQFLSYMLPFRGGCLLHSSGVVFGGKALGFFGISGSGKSTLARLAPGPVLTDESLGLTRGGDGWMAHATPFWGDYDAGPPPVTSAPLAALFRLVKGEQDRVSHLPWHIAVREMTASFMYHVSSPPYQAALLAQATTLAREVPCFELEFRPTRSVWQTVEQALAMV